MKIEDISVGQFLRVALTGEEAIVLSVSAADELVLVRVAKQTAQDGIKYVEQYFKNFELESLEDNIQRTIVEIRTKARLFKEAEERDAQVPAPTTSKMVLN